MPETIQSNLFADFLRAYEHGEADFAVVDGTNSRVVKSVGGKLSGIDDLASKIPVISAAFLTANGSQALRGFRCLLEGADVRKGEASVHFQYNGFWFYSSAEGSNEVRLRLGASESDMERAAEFRVRLDAEFGTAYEKEPREDKRRPLKFTRGYQLGESELLFGLGLADSNDGVSGRVYPYWRSYRNLMLKPVLRALNEVFPLDR